ncbi:DUF4817 domain-containing protein [Nephila pilipes]|uniref:DUF4817 domain-containing protein n=1 Tax=Nephila pilipes TaxID=299642 RepID=A0A8X6T2V9_NEPPI|nr:DUF4817 domain-containing protein [Nephila pilipes]
MHSAYFCRDSTSEFLIDDAPEGKLKGYINKIDNKLRMKTFSKRHAPSKDFIKRWYQQFKDTGSVKNKKAPSRPRIPTEDVDRYRETFMRNTSTSTRSVCLQLGIPRTTVRRILHKRLKLQPYKVHLLHELKPNDKPKRFDFVVRILTPKSRSTTYLKNAIFSDEATFHVSGYVNHHNYRI